MLEQNKTSFYLVEEDVNGLRYPLQKAFNGNGFQRAYEDSGIFRFDTEDKVKQACNLQNMMNSLFGSNKKISYCKEDIERAMFNEKGETITFEVPKTEDENTNPQANGNVIP